MTEEVVQKPQVCQNFIAPSIPRTLQHVSAQGTSTQVTTQYTLTSTPSGQQTHSSSSLRSTSTNRVKTRSLREIYEAATPNSFSLFAVLSPIYDTLTFDKSIKDELQEQAMDEEIKCIEKKKTWELVDVAKDKDVISLKWS